MSKSFEEAKAIKEMADKLGFSLSVRGGVLTCSKKFPSGSVEAFRECDMSYYSVLGKLKRTSPGSDWGTDGSGIGGFSAIQSGNFVMNRSGGSVRVLSALKKLL